MRVEFVADGDSFARRAWPLLIADEAHHTRLLGGLSAAADPPPSDPWCSALVIDTQADVIAAALLSTGPVAAFDAFGVASRGGPGFAACIGEAGFVDVGRHRHLTVPHES